MKKQTKRNLLFGGLTGLVIVVVLAVVLKNKDKTTTITIGKAPAPDTEKVNADFAKKATADIARIEADSTALRKRYIKAGALEKEAITNKLEANNKQINRLTKLKPKINES